MITDVERVIIFRRKYKGLCHFKNKILITIDKCKSIMFLVGKTKKTICYNKILYGGDGFVPFQFNDKSFDTTNDSEWRQSVNQRYPNSGFIFLRKNIEN